MEQRHVQRGQMAFGVFNLAVDFLEAFDVGLHELGIEAAAGSTLYEAQRESKPVRVLERHHRRNRFDLVLPGLVAWGDGLGQRIEPAGVLVGENVSNSGDAIREVLGRSPIHGFPLLGPGVDLFVGELPLVRHGISLNSQTSQCAVRRQSETAGTASGGVTHEPSASVLAELSMSVLGREHGQARSVAWAALAGIPADLLPCGRSESEATDFCACARHDFVMKLGLAGLTALALLVMPAPAPASLTASADFTSPAAVTPEGVHTQAADQATDREGDTAYVFIADGSFNLRVRRAGGQLTPVRKVVTPRHTTTSLRVAADDDGDGVVIWAEDGEEGEWATYLFARRFSRDGRLGPVVQITRDDHWVQGAGVALRPSGGAIITWFRAIGDGYAPYVRTLSVGNRLGPVHQLGRGPDVDIPLIAVERTGRATLLWTNNDLFARRLNTDGTLTATRLVRRNPGDGLVPNEMGFDRRGVLTASCARWSKNTATPPNSNSYSRACVLRLSPQLGLLEPVRNVSQADVQVDDWRVELGLAPSGAAVVGWQKTYHAGAWVHRVRPNGSLGSPVKVSDAGIGDIVLMGDGDGTVASTGFTADGLTRAIRVTPILDGVIGRTRTVGHNDYDTTYLRAGLTPRGRTLISWNEVGFAARILVIAGD